MKVGIYGPYFGTLGGGELYLGVIAETLSRNHQVDLLSEVEISLDDYSRHFGLNLSRVKLRVIPRAPFVESLNPLRLPRYFRTTAFTSEYDLIIVMPRNFRIPFRTRSRRSILHLQVPERPWSTKDFANAVMRGEFSEFRNQAIKRIWYPHRYSKFDAVLINSEFHRGVIETRLKNPRAIVLNPPISLKQPRPWLKKEQLILGVGRFFRGLHSKRHDVLISAMRAITSRLAGWRLALAGGLNAEASAQEYFRELQKLAEGLPVDFHPNIPLAELNDLYARTRIYWHAAGFGADLSSPERMEHFGISTVEAMSAGCIPVVYRGGGQLEIIEEGRNGFFWDTVAHLSETTLRVASMQEASAISEAAVQRSKNFGRDRFEHKLQEVIASLESNTRP